MRADQIDLALALFGLVALLLGAYGHRIRRGPASEPMVATIFGFLLGPEVAGLVDPRSWTAHYALIEHVARITLAIGLVEIALSLRVGALHDLRRSLLLGLGFVMPAMWAAGTGLLLLLTPLPLLVAALIGACITPTDPVVAGSIVSGRAARENIPDRLRDSLSAEAALNDGLAYPFVMLPLLFLASADASIGRWLIESVVLGVGAAVVAGIVLGYGFGLLLRRAREHGAAEEPAILLSSFALALVVLGAVHLLHSDGILAAFIAGVVFHHVVREEPDEERTRSSVSRFLLLPSFLIIGSLLPWSSWVELGWVALGLPVLVLLLRRIPAVLLTLPLSRVLVDWKSALFVGWFGPIGVAAAYYAALATTRTGDDRIWIWTSLFIAASIIAHGVTATPLTRLYGRSGGGRRDDR